MKRENIKLAKHRKEKNNQTGIYYFRRSSHISQSKATNNKKKVQGIKDETNC